MQAMDDDVADDKSLLIVLVETNPRYWESDRGKGEGTRRRARIVARFASDDYIFE